MPSKRLTAPKQASVKAATKPTTGATVKPATKTAAASKTRTTTSSAAPRARKLASSALAPLSHHDIAARAHDLYVQSGFEGHREIEFWLEAERQLKKRVKL